MSRKRRERRALLVSQNGGNHLGPVMRAVREAQAAGGLYPGRVSMIEVKHDDWCNLLAGRGPCNCDPVALPPRLVPTQEDN